MSSKPKFKQGDKIIFRASKNYLYSLRAFTVISNTEIANIKRIGGSQTLYHLEAMFPDGYNPTFLKDGDIIRFSPDTPNSYVDAAAVLFDSPEGIWMRL